MVNNESKARCFNFKNFTLDLERRLLLRDGEPVPLTPKAFDTLALLVRRSGHVVGKDELLDGIWADAFVEESTIAQNVFTLRKALGQNHTEHQFIETVPKHGYRFIADVKTIDGGALILCYVNYALQFIWQMRGKFFKAHEVGGPGFALSVAGWIYTF